MAVEAALSLLLDAGQVPTLSTTRALVRAPQVPLLPLLNVPALDLRQYDQLLGAAVTV